MMSLKSTLTLAILLAPFPVLPVAAQTADATTATAPSLQQGSTINNATKANQSAPGDARELSPDNKQSATGGPAGGFGRGGAAGGN